MHSRERHSALGIASCCVFLSGGVVAASVIAYALLVPIKMGPARAQWTSQFPYSVSPSA